MREVLNGYKGAGEEEGDEDADAGDLCPIGECGEQVAEFVQKRGQKKGE